MEIIYKEKRFKKICSRSCESSRIKSNFIDKFINDATEVDVDAISDGNKIFCCWDHGTY